MGSSLHALVLVERRAWRGPFLCPERLLICTRLLEEEHLTGSLHLRNFFVRRLFRIQPAALTYLLTVILLMLSGALEPAYASTGFALLNVRNYLPLTFPLKDWYTAHFWSLAVEEHFYLFLPFLLLFVRRGRGAVLLGCALLSSVWATGSVVTQRCSSAGHRRITPASL